MPIRPANLATMSATIAGAIAGLSNREEQAPPVRVTFESGYEQTLENGGCRTLKTGQGGVTGITTESKVRFALFAGTSCQGSRALASGHGSVSFGDPVLAGAIVIG
ncbi:hypothetical protein A6A08_14860 [Nocardiopsis sp. TSRI0078]|uniref:hypothetical protein n=1 Tax=unclassified Nocardiopsis TaxID=2649073 RepID=UPI00093AEB7F|nr:hypothetical protein [Nocardiopsis sp. TSRI0078]OKI13566.1 hypothetical protein A6A08_14860 [Nocardiopsis sp. TSRI0078]